MAETVQLTAAHWIYALFVILIFVTLALRKDTAIIAVVGMFILGWVLLGSPIGGLQGIFNGMLRSGVVLLDIVFIISIVVAMAKGLEPIGAIYLMVRPAQKLMRSPALAFWVTGAIMYIAALFLWPSPATALVGAILFPAALSVGLPAISVAMAMNLFGHGFCLATDYVIQGAPKLTAEAAGLPVSAILSASTPLNLVTTVVALSVAWFFVVRKDIKAHTVTETEYLKFEQDKKAAEDREYSTLAKTASWLVPLVFLVDVIILIIMEVRGGDATAVLGGTALALLSIFCIWQKGWSKGMEQITDCVREGFMFGMKVFAPVFLVAGFYLMGVPEHSEAIFGAAGKPLIIDLIKALTNVIPTSKAVVAVMHTILAGITGLDGSGFNDLPLMGALAASWGQALNLNTATLAALGQVAMIWIGGGVIVPWAVLPVSAITGVPAIDLCRKNFLPCIAGLTAATIVAIFLM
ncbi:MAG: hypothetical protein JXA42_06495 [Anaerolineales bacterium]|nr:hypothetical protein [Anaerolineales bacterium]